MARTPPLRIAQPSPKPWARTRAAHPDATPQGRTAPRGDEAAIDALAAAQHGVVSRKQLLEAGLSNDAVRHRLERARLRQVHRGVYRVGPIVGPLWREMAAVLACGAAAAVSERSAGAVLRVLQRPTRDRDPVDLFLFGGAFRCRPGIRTRRVTLGSPDETIRVDGVPVTSPARTLLDLGAVLDPHEVEQALATAMRAALVSADALQALLERHPRHPGGRRLRPFLRDGAEPAFTRSAAEELLLALLDSAGLPRPSTNKRVLGYEVDAVWPAQHLILDVDGYAFHSSRDAFERDRKRDLVLTTAGFRVIRITWRQLHKERDATIALLAQALLR